MLNELDEQAYDAQTIVFWKQEAIEMKQRYDTELAKLPEE